ncbi:hypothetical protein HB364_07125 [Pseudoflavitalea sp. X16]|uniref:hypothetical protein n=1 Tax=Paraflavitalea devenefica TaxID=2716334 RepID=UPI001420E0D7|nr:hypothetical protein [Paraflavitalea devenefica]NII24842.1 hypothetical protein [Paraflavitalea devenefica]
MNRLKILIAFLLIASHIVTAQHTNVSTPLAKNDMQWIQKVLDNWNLVCRKELKIKENPLPWIIFYDSTAAWHLNPDKKLLPPFEKTAYRFIYDRQNYELIRISHSMNVWVPDRAPVPMGSLPTVAMPYANNQKCFFIAPLPTLFHLLATPDYAVYLNFLFLGIYIHELTHTRQLPFVLSKLLQIQHNYKLPESIDDNTIENTFGKNETYKQLFFAEKGHLWNAVFNENTDSCIAHIEQAFRIADRRKKEFLSGDSLGYDKLDDIFISLEGSAMWAQYRIMLKTLQRTWTRRRHLGGYWRKHRHGRRMKD